MIGRRCAIVWLMLGCGLTGTDRGARADDAVDFRRDVLPILSDRCFQCHGPDAGSRKANLRLDLEADLIRARDPLVVPGKAAESELILRILSDDDQERMPPPESHLTLKPDQVEILRRWVDEGARWQNHWAFVPPRRVEPPRTNRDGWAINPIDRFILAKLESEGLAPALEADRATWLRRATLDLTGLPPTPTEVDAFLADSLPGSWDRVVDRLLASPRHAERLTTDWLDLARYADTHGYQADRAIAVWPWRDWVVGAIARNQPFDQFVTWQLAGDLLPDATREQTLATAFNRLHMQNEEGGIVAEEFRVAYVADRVNTFATGLLGLTFECARCHDHKFDPIPQRDYYGLFAFFQNIDESGQTSHFTHSTPVPALLLTDDATEGKLTALNRQIKAIEAEKVADDDAGFRNWIDARAGARPPAVGLVGSNPFEDTPADRPADPEQGLLATKLVGTPARVEGKVGQGAALDGQNGFRFPGVGHFTRSDPFTIGLSIKVPVGLTDAVLVHHSKAPIDAGSRGYEILLEDGRIAFGLHQMWPGNSLKVRTEQPVPRDAWVHVAVSSDGSSRADGARIYLDGQLATVETIRDGLTRDITYGGGGEPDLAIGHRFRDTGFKGGQVDEFRLCNRALTPIEVADLAGRPDLTQSWTTPSPDLTADQLARLRDLYRATVAPESLARTARLLGLRRLRDRLIEPVPEIMVMRELAQPRPAHILVRGAYDAPGAEVTASTPTALPPIRPDLPRNRLGLARWLFDPGHPLTARVEVNRLWQLMFGRGLVETSENFGRQGTPPSHPELLDWLAVEFVESGWDVRHILRLMATSATYRQSSRTDAATRERDSSNLLLARGPARKLSAEMLRDQALAASGLLNEASGGPPVRPYQPAGLYDVASGGGYQQSRGADLYRRSLYTVWKRTIPHPALVIFDAADRSNCAVRRQTTSTPLQALALLNDPQIVEAARHLAQRALQTSGPDDPARSAWIYRQVLGRGPAPAETAILTQLLAEQRAHFATDRAAAAQLLAVGESKPDPTLDPVELAALSVLADAILNHNAAIYRR